MAQTLFPCGPLSMPLARGPQEKRVCAPRDCSRDITILIVRSVYLASHWSRFLYLFSWSFVIGNGRNTIIALLGLGTAPLVWIRSYSNLYVSQIKV